MDYKTGVAVFGIANVVINLITNAAIDPITNAARSHYCGRISEIRPSSNSKEGIPPLLTAAILPSELI